MQKQRFSQLALFCTALCCTALLQTGCSSVAVRTAQSAERSAADSVQGVGTAAPGSIVELPAGNAIGVSQVRVIDEYRAASGRLCRRVQLPQNADSVRVMCQRTNGQWTFTRALVTSSMSRRIHGDGLASVPFGVDAIVTFNPESKTVKQDIPANELFAPALSQKTVRLEEGETLWRFATRTTGDPTNWSAIAEFNGIADASTIRSGTMLKIPAELNTGSP